MTNTLKLNKITVDDAQRIKSSDREFSRFIRTNSNFLRKIVWSYLRKNSLNENDSELFEDAFQEALLSLWLKALPKYNGSTKFSTFAYRVIKNDVLGFLQSRSKFESNIGQNVSMEKLKKGDANELSGEYKESLFKQNKTKISFEDQIIETMDEKKRISDFSAIDFKIYNFRKLGWKRDAIAQALGMNVHTYKAHLYGSYFPKLKKLGIEDNEAE
jgi:RNA polymerase sigma factor (sigma-70 family)